MGNPVPEKVEDYGKNKEVDETKETQSDKAGGETKEETPPTIGG